MASTLAGKLMPHGDNYGKTVELSAHGAGLLKNIGRPGLLPAAVFTVRPHHRHVPAHGN